MSEMKQLAKMEVILNDMRDHPSCPHGMFAVVFLMTGVCFRNLSVIFRGTVWIYVVV